MWMRLVGTPNATRKREEVMEVGGVKIHQVPRRGSRLVEAAGRRMVLGVGRRDMADGNMRIGHGMASRTTAVWDHGAPATIGRGATAAVRENLNDMDAAKGKYQVSEDEAVMGRCRALQDDHRLQAMTGKAMHRQVK